MSDLYRLVYASRNLIAGTEAEVAATVTQILSTSQRNNAKVGVTGALMFNAGAFAQVLEGPRRAVEETFERIQRDLKHSDVTVLECGRVESRGFSNWSMAFAGRSVQGQARFSNLAAESGFNIARLSGDKVFAMLHELVIDEEGIPAAEIATAAAGSPGSATLDVEQLRAEITQLRPNAAAAAPASTESFQPSMAAVDRKQRSETSKDPARSKGAGDAVLSVLKAALVSERQRTTELRTEIDSLQIALAASEDGLAAMRAERDLWAGRARLLANAMAQEAGDLHASLGASISAQTQPFKGPQLGDALERVAAA